LGAETGFQHVTLGEEKKDYVIASEDGLLVWLAKPGGASSCTRAFARNRISTSRITSLYDFDRRMVILSRRVTEMALEFRSISTRSGIIVRQTTGRKGLHVLTPIEPKWTFRSVRGGEGVAQPFVERMAEADAADQETARGKVLLDIYRNRQSQTIAAAYSVRGLAGAPVSTPLQWGRSCWLESSKAFDLTSVPQRVIENGTVGSDRRVMRRPIHTATGGKRKKDTPALRAKTRWFRRRRLRIRNRRSTRLPGTRKAILQKRSFEKTPEPPPAPIRGWGQCVLVHRTRLAPGTTSAPGAKTAC